MLFDLLAVFSTGILGIFLGAQIAEAVLFVPYWKFLSAKEFFELHKVFGKKIYRFFAPTLIPLLTVAFGLYTNRYNGLAIVLMGIFTLLFFSTYPLYFKNANQKFADASISHNDLPAELNKWGNWHWLRIVFEFIAFICSIIVLLNL